MSLENALQERARSLEAVRAAWEKADAEFPRLRLIAAGGEIANEHDLRAMLHCVKIVVAELCIRRADRSIVKELGENN